MLNINTCIKLTHATNTLNTEIAKNTILKTQINLKSQSTINNNNNAAKHKNPPSKLRLLGGILQNPFKFCQ